MLQKPSGGDRFLLLAHRVERFLLRLVVLSVLLLVAVQGLMMDDQGKRLLTAIDRLEGRLPEGESEQAVWVNAAVPRGGVPITLHLITAESAPEARVLLNGTTVARFTTASQQVRVRPGQVLEVDGSAYRQPLLFRVTAVDPSLTSPGLGKEVITQGDVQSFGLVR